ncbi:MAG TPA: AsmA-like C-terminal region-containing protein [Gammaproteobacteria bacterium]|nr:AsmA-like C-terminal region-containing protein [Gammaproteobacteria bacterium]
MTLLRRRLIASCVAAFLVLAVSGICMSKMLATKVNTFVLNLAEHMTNELGHPVQIEKVVTRWDWFFLKVNIKNLRILDQNNGSQLFMASDIISTVDTIASIRSMTLKFKQLLLRNPRLVMQWNGIEPPVVLGLDRDGVSGQLNPVGMAKILAAQRHIVIENGDLHLQGKDGADLPFMDIRIDFHQHAEQEYSVTARGNIAAAVQPEFVLAIKYYGDLAEYAKAMLEFSLKTSNMQLAELFKFIPQLKHTVVAGNFADFDLKGVVQNGTVRSVTSDFTISNINLDSSTQIAGGTGHIEYKPGNNSSAFQLSHVHLLNDKLYSQPITVDAINGELIYTELDDGQINIATQNMHVKLLEMDLEPKLNAQISANKLAKLSVSVEPEGAALRKLLVLLPDQKFPAGLSDWFKRSFIDGNISLAQLNYENQKLWWSLDFKNTELKFSPEWPSVHNIEATLVMDNGELSVVASKAMLLGQPLKTLKNTYAAFNGKPYTVIKIDGTIDTTLEAALNYIQQSPLRDHLGSKIEPFNPSGQAALALQLAINLGKPTVSVDVAGTLRLQQAKITAADLNIPVENINGTLKFTNNSFTSENLRLTLLDYPATAKMGMHAVKPNTLNIGIDMPLQVAALRKVLPGVNFDHIEGVANIVANLELPWGGDKQTKTLFVTSDLEGVAINYPAPFHKVSASRMPLHLQFAMNHKHEDTVKIKLGSVVDSVLYLKDSKLHGGRVAINRKLESTEESESLVITGEVNKFDWSEWSGILQKGSTQNDWLPLEVDILVNSLVFAGDDYKTTRVKYNSGKNQLALDSDIVTGTLRSNVDEEKIEIVLEKLNVPENRVKSNALLDHLRAKHAANQLPLVQIYCEKLRLNKRLFKKVSLELLPRTYGYEIMNFSINNDNLTLQAQGAWQMDDKSVTTVAGNIYTQNFGKVLAEWGYANSISRGKGELSFSVHWDGGPIDFDILKVAGASHLDLRSGNLTNVNPGMGRIIGLLSLESIHRRLQLDFSDILSRGFAFDKFVADLKIEPGSVMSDNVLITSPAAKIELFGKAGIKSQDLDLTMYVTPKVGAGLPIAAAIAAGNPAVGAAIWLFDKASGSKISEITKYKYRVTGTWEKPDVNEVL